MSRVFWEAQGYDAEGNLIVKVFNQENQKRMAQLVEEADKKKKKLEKPLVGLTAAGEFDAMVDALLDTEAVYMVPGAQTGKNLRVDYDKLNAKAGNTNKGEKQERVPREKQVVVLTAVGDDAW